jgi:hypothetical protein
VREADEVVAALLAQQGAVARGGGSRSR